MRLATVPIQPQFLTIYTPYSPYPIYTYTNIPHPLLCAIMTPKYVMVCLTILCEIVDHTKYTHYLEEFSEDNSEEKKEVSGEEWGKVCSGVL